MSKKPKNVCSEEPEMKACGCGEHDDAVRREADRQTALEDERAALLALRGQGGET